LKLTRREFLRRSGALAGGTVPAVLAGGTVPAMLADGTYPAMLAMGLIPAAPAPADRS